MSAIVPVLTTPEARALTDEVKADAAALWAKLLQLYEGKAHVALGFTSWGAYYTAEFGESANHGDRLLRAGRVLEAIGDNPTGLRTEATARELAPILRNGSDAVREAWEETVERHGPEPTAKQVREVVRKREPERAMPSWAVRIGLVADELRRIARDPHGEHDLHAALELLAGAEQELKRQLQAETVPTPPHLSAVEAAQEHVTTSAATPATGVAGKGHNRGDTSGDRAETPQEDTRATRGMSDMPDIARRDGQEHEEARNEGSPGAQASERVTPEPVAPPCGRAGHAGWDWCAVAGGVQCGICHAPAAPELVAQFGPRWDRFERGPR
jgi:hypothetical protein